MGFGKLGLKILTKRDEILLFYFWCFYVTIWQILLKDRKKSKSILEKLSSCRIGLSFGTVMDNNIKAHLWMQKACWQSNITSYQNAWNNALNRIFSNNFKITDRYNYFKFTNPMWKIYVFHGKMGIPKCIGEFESFCVKSLYNLRTLESVWFTSVRAHQRATLLKIHHPLWTTFSKSSAEVAWISNWTAPQTHSVHFLPN